MNESRSTTPITPNPVPVRHWKLTADQYQRMGEVGILRKDDRFRSDFYRGSLPGPEDVLLLVEVSDTTLVYD
ncbi:MAG: hypothetical protein ACR2PL_07620 [Dehalococcoidia bacterium]